MNINSYNLIKKLHMFEESIYSRLGLNLSCKCLFESYDCNDCVLDKSKYVFSKDLNIIINTIDSLKRNKMPFLSKKNMDMSFSFYNNDIGSKNEISNESLEKKINENDYDFRNKITNIFFELYVEICSKSYYEEYISYSENLIWSSAIIHYNNDYPNVYDNLCKRNNNKIIFDFNEDDCHELLSHKFISESKNYPNCMNLAFKLSHDHTYILVLNVNYITLEILKQNVILCSDDSL